MHISVGFISRFSAEADIGWGKKNWTANGQLCPEYSYQNLWESDNLCSS